MASIDLVGHTYGDLTVLERVEQDRLGRWKWLCECRCGSRVIAASNNLRTGNTKSCGCMRSIPRRREDLTGFKFGRFTVERYTHTQGGRACWLCRCSCGTERVFPAIKIKHGGRVSCGCAKTDPSNMSAGRWSRLIRQMQEYCAKCGSVDDLHAHHIFSKTLFPERSRLFSNGVALCGDCHRQFHSRFGKGGPGAAELTEFLGNPQIAEILDLIAGYEAKGGVQDLRKARHYLDMLIEREAGNG